MVNGATDKHIIRAAPIVLVLISLVALAGCGGGEETPRQEMSQRERDSVIGQSNLPGAQGVRGALEVTDSAAARRRLEDSIASN